MRLLVWTPHIQLGHCVAAMFGSLAVQVSFLRQSPKSKKSRNGQQKSKRVKEHGETFCVVHESRDKQFHHRMGSSKSFDPKGKNF